MYTLNENLEMLRALIELRVIKRESMNLFFELEDAYGRLARLRGELLDGNKHHQIVAHKMDDITGELNELIYELQSIINIGEI